MLEISYKMFPPIGFNFIQFLDFKLSYLLNYWGFSDFDPFTGYFLAIGRYYLHFEVK